MWLLATACTTSAPVGEVYVPRHPPVEGTEDSVPVADPLPALRLNELQSDNQSTWMDASFAFPDWVELHNGTDAEIDLAEVTLEDEAGLLWTGAGALAPGARVQFACDGIDAGGDELTLSLAGVPVDRIATGEMPPDTAWARFPDGGTWLPTARPTPGETNGTHPPASLDPSEALFDTILDLDLGLPDASIASLGSAPTVEVPASLGFRGIVFPEVSVHLKGVYGSFRTLDQKAAFSIDVNEYVDQRLRGLETLKLNNMVQDPTYVHEALTYAFFRHMGVPAPRTGWARVTVNGTYYGLYAFIEAEDDRFLSRWFADNSGNLYEGAYGVDFYGGYEFYFECDECADPSDRTDIIAVTRILDGPADDAHLEALERAVDLDEVLTEQAVEAILLHWDGYETANNYRVYHDPTSGQFSMIPWGTDQTFVDQWFGPYDGYGRILQFCLANAACAARYDEILLRTADAFEAFDFTERLNGMLAMLEADIATDPRKEWGTDLRQFELQATRATINEGADRIRAAVDAR